jgi:ABC-type phosphate/phosphonate transport system substrate-binding protein
MRILFASVLAGLLILGGACRRDRSDTGTPGNPFTIVTSSAYATPEVARELEVALFFAAKVLPEAREKVTRALFELAATPEGRAVFERLGGITGFEPITDDAYREVHDLPGDIDRSVADLVPGGRHLVDTRHAPFDIGPI